MFRISILILILGSALSGSAQNSSKRLFSPATNYMQIRQDTAVVEFSFLRKSKEVRSRSNVDYFYFKAGELHQSQGGYSEYLLQGEFREFSPSFDLRTKGRFKHGMCHGKWEVYNFNSQIIKASRYRKGLLCGRQLTYNPDGVVRKIERFKKGKLHGKVIIFTPKGTEEVHYYKKGEEVALESLLLRNLIHGFFHHSDKPEKVDKKAEQPILTEPSPNAQ